VRRRGEEGKKTYEELRDGKFVHWDHRKSGNGVSKGRRQRANGRTVAAWWRSSLSSVVRGGGEMAVRRVSSSRLLRGLIEGAQKWALQIAVRERGHRKAVQC